MPAHLIRSKEFTKHHQSLCDYMQLGSFKGYDRLAVHKKVIKVSANRAWKAEALGFARLHEVSAPFLASISRTI